MMKLPLALLLFLPMLAQARPHHPWDGRAPEPFSLALPEITRKSRLKENLPMQLQEPMAKLARAQYRASGKKAPGRR